MVHRTYLSPSGSLHVFFLINPFIRNCSLKLSTLSIRIFYPAKKLRHYPREINFRGYVVLLRYSQTRLDLLTIADNFDLTRVDILYFHRYNELHVH